MYPPHFDSHHPDGDGTPKHDPCAPSRQSALPLFLDAAQRVHPPMTARQSEIARQSDSPNNAPDRLFQRNSGTQSARILQADDSLGAAPADPWRHLAPVPFAHAALTPLDAQLDLTGDDQALLRSFDDLRTQLLSAMQLNGWSRIAIVAPTTGCGASFTAVNLALAIARIPDARAILMDLDLRAPAVARMLGMTSPGDISDSLSGHSDLTSHLLRASNTLALGLGCGNPQNRSDILHARRTVAALKSMTAALRPDIVLYDLPAMLEYDDLEAFLPQVDGVLLVADATRTLARQISECERRLSGKTNLLGIILNRTRGQRRPRPHAA